MRKSIVPLVVLLLASMNRAEELPCTVQLPVSVLLPDGALIRNLNRDQIVVKGKNGPLPTTGLVTDKAPRRIVLVAETGERVSAPARTITANVLSEIVSKARPEDSFALLTARGPLRQVHFGENRDVLQNVINDLAAKAPGKSPSPDLLDALQQAVAWLQPHQRGDAILVLTVGLEDDRSRTKYPKVRDALGEAGIRLFGFQLGGIVSGFIHEEWTPLPGGPGVRPSASMVANREGLDSLSRESGGFIFVEDTSSPVQAYKLTDERLKLIKGRGRQLYKAAAEFYLLTATSFAKDFSIDVSDEVRKQLPAAMVAYPRWSPACPAAGAGNPIP
jgi:hypothetical protein